MQFELSDEEVSAIRGLVDYELTVGDVEEMSEEQFSTLQGLEDKFKETEATEQHKF
jgi:hypothetical protein